MADIKIYGVPPSSFTRTVLLACHEKGIDYELVPMFPGQMGALNPFQKIPGDRPWRHDALRIDRHPALPRSHFPRSEAVAAGIRVRRRCATSG